MALCGTQCAVPDGIGMPGDPDRFATIYDVWCLGPLAIGRIGSGCDGWVQCGEERPTYDIKLPETGLLESVHRGSPVMVGRGAAALLLPEGDMALRWGESSVTLCVNIDRRAVDDALSDALGREVLAQIDFDPTMSTARSEFRAWTNLLRLLMEQLSRPHNLLSNPLVGTPFVDCLVRGLLLATDHPHRAAMAREVAQPAPQVVRTAIDIIEAEPDLPWTVSSLAARSYTSVRSLQVGFQRYLEVSPMAYLREVRLRRAHEDLLRSDPSTATVTSVAYRWGFNNVSRFGALHKERYRESPATTLRRAAS